MEILIKFRFSLLILSLFVAYALSAITSDQQPAAVVPPDKPPDSSENLVSPVPFAMPIAIQPEPPDSPEDLNDPVPFATPLWTQPEPDHNLSFYMHDIVGGSSPSARAMTGIVNNPTLNRIPFAKRNGIVFPDNNRVKGKYGDVGAITDNSIPFFTGLGGTVSDVLQSNGNNNGLGINGVEIQQLLFGTITVIDDELTEGDELGSGLVGKAQGYYVASSIDGKSQTMAFTAMFESGDYIDSLSFLGVHRTGVSQSQLAIMGGTGKYVNAKGFAIVKTIPPKNQQDTDGLETLLQFSVYVTC